MKINLAAYADKKICVAVSGGRDSMALLHYLFARCGGYGIALSALNCDHGIRGDDSVRDSEFVLSKCREWGIPVFCFKGDCPRLAKERGISLETAAREWRLFCYYKASQKAGGAVIATAHHADDNAETVLFNLARGSGLAGAAGIRDGRHTIPVAEKDGEIFSPWECGADAEECSAEFEIVRPLKRCTSEEIAAYVAGNGIPFVEDKSNFTDDYTRNYIRHNVLPALETAVHGAAGNILRFSRLAAETEGYIAREAERKFPLITDGNCVILPHCAEYVLFSHNAVRALKERFRKKDYTLSHIDSLFCLQSAQNGKKFEFLGLTACKEAEGVSIFPAAGEEAPVIAFKGFKSGIYGGKRLEIIENLSGGERVDNAENAACRYAKPLRFDLDKIPQTAVIRAARRGDRFKKFGGGTKSLGDYFTDIKLPLRLRGSIPLIADGSEILAVCGVEISDKIKVTDKTERERLIICGAQAGKPV